MSFFSLLSLKKIKRILHFVLQALSTRFIWIQNTGPNIAQITTFKCSIWILRQTSALNTKADIHLSNVLWRLQCKGLRELIVFCNLHNWASVECFLLRCWRNPHQHQHSKYLSHIICIYTICNGPHFSFLFYRISCWRCSSLHHLHRPFNIHR